MVTLTQIIDDHYKYTSKNLQEVITYLRIEGRSRLKTRDDKLDVIEEYYEIYGDVRIPHKCLTLRVRFDI